MLEIFLYIISFWFEVDVKWYLIPSSSIIIYSPNFIILSNIGSIKWDKIEFLILLILFSLFILFIWSVLHVLFK